MSVNYGARLTFGWKVFFEDYIYMNELTNSEFEGYFISSNSYYESDYIFGKTIARVDENCEIWKIDAKRLLNDNDENWLISAREVLQKCGRPDLVSIEPSIYLVFQVN